MTCTTAESAGVKLAVIWPAISVSTSVLQTRLNPAPLGWRLLDVKSALLSLEWTAPNVPKPLKKNIRVSGLSAQLSEACNANATSAMAASHELFRTRAIRPKTTIKVLVSAVDVMARNRRAQFGRSPTGTKSLATVRVRSRADRGALRGSADTRNTRR